MDTIIIPAMVTIASIGVMATIYWYDDSRTRKLLKESERIIASLEGQIQDLCADNALLIANGAADAWKDVPHDGCVKQNATADKTAYNRAYYQANKDKINARVRAHKARKLAATKTTKGRKK